MKFLGDIVEENGKTVRENNLERSHNYPLGTVVEMDVEINSHGYDAPCNVELKGKCTLVIVGHMRDCDGTPLYIVSNRPIEYPMGKDIIKKALYKMLTEYVETGIGENNLTPVDDTDRLEVKSFKQSFNYE